MPATGGRHMPTAYVDQVITDVGHTPEVVLFLMANNGSEDALQASPGLLSFGLMQRTADRVNPYSMMSHFWWNGTTPASSYLWDIICWARGGPNGALYGWEMSEDDDWFSLRYAGGGFDNVSGVPLYWLALSGPNPPEFLHLRPPAGVFGFTDSTVEEAAMPWEATSAIAIGSGSPGAGVGSISYNNICIPTWAVWSKAAADGSSIYDVFGGSSMNLGYGINQAAYNSFWNTDWFTNRVYAYDQDLTLQTVHTGAFGLSSDEDTFYADWHYPGGAWVGNWGRIGVCAMYNLLGQNGEIDPGANVDDEVTISCPFDIACVIFMSGGYSENPGGASNVKVGPMIGMCAADTRPGDDEPFQAVVAAGGQQNVSALRYQSPNRAWVSNYNGPTGTGIHAGSCLIEGSSFTITTRDANRPPQQIMYAALGFEVTEQPVIYRHGIRYR